MSLSGTLRTGSLAAVSAAMVMSLNATAFAACSGVACPDLSINQRNNCIILVNRNSQHRIRVETSSGAPVYVYYVYANSELEPRTINGYCHSNWYTNWTAVFSD